MASPASLRYFRDSSASLFRSIQCRPTNNTANVNSRALSARRIHTTSPRAALYTKADVATFKKVTGAKDRIVLVDFYADWCGPCHQLSPVIERLTQEPNKSGSGLPLDLVKVDTDSDDGMQLGGEHKVSALPTVIAFRDGKPVLRFVGALPESHLKDFIQKL